MPVSRFGETDIGWLRRWRARVLLSSFAGDPDDIYRAVHRLRDNEFFVAAYARDFFERTDELLKSNRVRAVRRLLVFGNVEERTEPLSRAIISFHRGMRGYDCRLIHAMVYESVLTRHGIATVMDFGIFGNKRLYRARTDRPDHVLGTWTRRGAEIRQYIAAFDDAWAEASVPSPAEADLQIDLPSLFTSAREAAGVVR